MSYSGGVYTAPANSWNPAVAGAAINATDWASLLADLSAALSLCVLKDGTQVLTANIPMGGFKLTGLAAGTANGNSVRWEQTLAGLSTTKGDIVSATGANAIARLAVGSDNAVLQADSTATGGVSWNTSGGFTTGDVKLTIKTVADTGWVLMNDGTIGDASSGGTTRANADTSALFTLLWNNTANADCAVSSGRGGTAAADFAAHKTIALPKALGRALATFGAGAGLTNRTLAHIVGAESYQIATTDLPALTFAGVATNWETVGGSAATVARGNGSSSTGSFNPGGTVNAGSPNTAISLMNPMVFLNVMIKL